MAIWHQVKKQSQKPIRFFSFACNFPKSPGMGNLSAPPWPFQPEGAAVFVTMPGKEKRSSVEQLEKAPVPKSPSSSPCQCCLQRGAQRTACQLFSRLRKSGFLSPWLGWGTCIAGRQPRIYTERSKEGWEASDLSLIENPGLGAGRKLHSQPIPSADEKWSPERVTQLSAQGSRHPEPEGLSRSGA